MDAGVEMDARFFVEDGTARVSTELDRVLSCWDIFGELDGDELHGLCGEHFEYLSKGQGA